jgi:arylsulfatase A-like enzyme
VADFDFLAPGVDCTYSHRGVHVDLGTPESLGYLTSRRQAQTLELGEVSGATIAKVRGRSLGLTTFATLEDLRGSEDAGVAGQYHVTARLAAGTARSVTFVLGGKVVGTERLVGNQLAVVSATIGDLTLTAGSLDVELRFSPQPGAPPGPLAEVDWVHVGPGPADPTYMAPTKAEVVTRVTAQGITRRGFAVRGPGAVRCTAFAPPRSELTVHLTAQGTAGAEGQVRMLRDRVQPAVLGRAEKLDQAVWQDVRWPVIAGEHRTLTTFEFSAKATRDASKSRVFFGEPALVSLERDGTPSSRTKPRAKNVVVVVLSSLSATALPPLGSTLKAPELGALARDSLAFIAHRSDSLVSAGVWASLLTGADVDAHAVTDNDASLSPAVPTLAEALGQAGIRTAFFGDHPLLGPASGLLRGFRTVERYAVDGPPQVTFGGALRYIESMDAEGRPPFFAVIAARAGHPPWDVAPKTLRTLPPERYAGFVDPLHAGELLGKRTSPFRLSDADRTRAWALYENAVTSHDGAFGELMAFLARTGRLADTAVLVTSDLAPSPASSTPFAEGVSLDESALAVPLWVRPPADARLSPQRIDVPTGVVDVPRTVVGLFGLDAPVTFRGADLFELASLGPLAPIRAHRVTAGSRFSVRWGPYVLIGSEERDVRFCDMSLEPACITDVRSTNPLAWDAVRRHAYRKATESKAAAPRVGATIDPETGARMKLWGY